MESLSLNRKRNALQKIALTIKDTDKLNFLLEVLKQF